MTRRPPTSPLLPPTTLSSSVVTKTITTNADHSVDLSVFQDGTITAAISATDTAGNSATGTGASTLLDTSADTIGTPHVSTDVTQSARMPSSASTHNSAARHT